MFLSSLYLNIGFVVYSLFSIGKYTICFNKSYINYLHFAHIPLGIFFNTRNKDGRGVENKKAIAGVAIAFNVDPEGHDPTTFGL